MLASCTSTGDPTLSVGMPAYNAAPSDYSASSAGNLASAASDSSLPVAASAEMQAATDMAADPTVALPEQVAFFPSPRPDAGIAVAALTGAEALSGNVPPQQLLPQGQTAEQTAEAAAKVAAGNAQVLHPATAPDGPVTVTAGDMPAPQAPIAPKKKSFLAALFGSSPAEAAPAPAAIAKATQPAKPLITLASAQPSARPVALASTGGDHGFADALPGVRQTALFEIKRKSGMDDDSDVDLNEDDGGLYQVASAAGMARLAPNGLLTQTESVDVACLKPSLVRVLKSIEGHYGKKVTVTSGYRNEDRNRLARGAKNSLHMYCAAADILVPGIGKWELANYLRSMPGRGGVGTYCHTDAVHVDVGPERDWNWRCRRRK